MVRILILLAAIAGWGAVSLCVLVAPEPPAGVAPPDQFDSARALIHLEAIAQRPRPAGSPENARVRQYLLAEFEKLGLEVSTQEQMAVVSRGRERQSCPLHNIIARLPGTQPGQPAVMLAAHFDSVFTGPGAADDGAAVAAILEALRALRAGPPLRRDIVVLLTDGEELGLLGARAFVQDEKLFQKTIGDPAGVVVLNFESRGTSGPSIMFETSAPNLQLVRHFAASAPIPVASSLAYDVYRLMPNNTDFTIFRRAGLNGLNFAMIDNYQHYHQTTDDLAHLDRRSMYHHGTYALALTRHFANLDPKQFVAIASAQQPNAVYFNGLGRWLIVYSATWIRPVGALQFALAIGAIALLLYRRITTGRAILLGGLRLLLALGAVAGAVYVIAGSIGRLEQSPGLDPKALIVIATALIVSAAVFGSFIRPATLVGLACAVLVLLIPLGVVATLYVPGASYLIQWPGIFVAIGMTLLGLDGRARWAALAWSLLAIGVVLVLWLPTLYMALGALTMRLAHFVAIGGAIFSGLILAAGLPYLTSRAKS